MTDIDGGVWHDSVAAHIGALFALAAQRPASGLQESMHGRYKHPGNAPGGPGEWLADHPEPEPN